MAAAARRDGHSCLLKSRPQLRFFEDSRRFFLFFFYLITAFHEIRLCFSPPYYGRGSFK